MVVSDKWREPPPRRFRSRRGDRRQRRRSREIHPHETAREDALARPLASRRRPGFSRRRRRGGAQEHAAHARGLRRARPANCRTRGCDRRRRELARSRRLSETNSAPRSNAMGSRASAVLSRARSPTTRCPRSIGSRPRSCSPQSRKALGSACWRRWRRGTPVVVSRIAPFVEYVGEEDALFCDPLKPASIASAMRAGAARPTRPRAFARAGFALAAKHSWRAVAERSLPFTSSLREPAYA